MLPIREMPGPLGLHKHDLHVGHALARGDEGRAVQVFGVQAILVALRDVGSVGRECTRNSLARVVIPEACLVLVGVWSRLGLGAGASVWADGSIDCLSSMLRHGSGLCSAHGDGEERGSWGNASRERTGIWGPTQYESERMEGTEGKPSRGGGKAQLYTPYESAHGHARERDDPAQCSHSANPTGPEHEAQGASAIMTTSCRGFNGVCPLTPAMIPIQRAERGRNR